MSCCPAGSWPALQAPTDYKRQGKVGVIHGDIQAYTVGSTAGAKRAILVLTDIFGIDSGRVQAVTINWQKNMMPCVSLSISCQVMHFLMHC